MKKLLFVIPIIISCLCFSCKDNNIIQKAVDDFRAGKISEDSLIAFVSDSINVQETFE